MVIADVTVPAGTLKRIHIHTGKIRQYHQDGIDQPCVIVRTHHTIYHGRNVEIVGDSKVIQSLTKPMPGCGARIWIETRGEVRVAQAVEEEVCSV